MGRAIKELVVLPLFCIYFKISGNANNKETNMDEKEYQELAEKFDMPVEAVKGFCGILDEVRNGLGNKEAMEKIQVLAEADFESEVNPA